MICSEPNGIVPHISLTYLFFPLGASVTFATIYIVEEVEVSAWAPGARGHLSKSTTHQR
jgi:hypothetical protein